MSTNQQKSLDNNPPVAVQLAGLQKEVTSLRPGWVQRTSVCKKCTEAMEPGSPRLELRFKRGTRWITLRYHRVCGLEIINQWWVDNPYEPTKYGRSDKDAANYLKNTLTHTELTERRLTVSKLGNILDYYQRRSPIRDKWGIIHPKRVERFAAKFKELCDKLETLGGIPDKYTLIDVEGLLKEHGNPRPHN